MQYNIKEAEQVLIDNGIEQDEASTVLQALGYVLLNEELYPYKEYKYACVNCSDQFGDKVVILDGNESVGYSCPSCGCATSFPEEEGCWKVEKQENNMIVNATFVSVWDEYEEIESDCKINIETKEVFDIELVNVDDMDILMCTDEYIIMNDGTKHGVLNVDTMSIYYDAYEDYDGYWYND